MTKQFETLRFFSRCYVMRKALDPHFKLQVVLSCIPSLLSGASIIFLVKYDKVRYLGIWGHCFENFALKFIG